MYSFWLADHCYCESHAPECSSRSFSPAMEIKQFMCLFCWQNVGYFSSTRRRYCLFLPFVFCVLLCSPGHPQTYDHSRYWDYKGSPRCQVIVVLVAIAVSSVSEHTLSVDCRGQRTWCIGVGLEEMAPGSSSCTSRVCVGLVALHPCPYLEFSGVFPFNLPVGEVTLPGVPMCIMVTKQPSVTSLPILWNVHDFALFCSTWLELRV